MTNRQTFIPAYRIGFLVEPKSWNFIIHGWGFICFLTALFSHYCCRPTRHGHGEENSLGSGVCNGSPHSHTRCAISKRVTAYENAPVDHSQRFYRNKESIDICTRSRFTQSLRWRPKCHCVGGGSPRCRPIDGGDGQPPRWWFEIQMKLPGRYGLGDLVN